METNFVLIKFFASLLAFLFALTFHEFSHALAAYALGDDTAERAGRLTLNPLAHIDALGMLFFFIFRIGWAKPVPMNAYNFRYPRIYSILAALAGPFSNFIVALSCLYLIAYFPLHLIADPAATFFGTFLKNSARINVMLGVFNALPVPPLDGGHIINALIPERYYPIYYRLMPVALIALLIFLSMDFTNKFLLDAINATYTFLQRLVL